jgi:hypothetical protein
MPRPTAAALNSTLFTTKLHSIVKQQLDRIRKREHTDEKIAESLILEGMIMIGQGFSLISRKEADALLAQSDGLIPAQGSYAPTTYAPDPEAKSVVSPAKQKREATRNMILKVVAKRRVKGITPPDVYEVLAAKGVTIDKAMVHYYLSALVAKGAVVKSKERTAGKNGAPPSYLYKVVG